MRMRRALYEYAITGVCTNIPFHMAVMKNARFLSGELDTHFIESEASLQEEVTRIIKDQTTLEAKLPKISENPKRIAAISAVATIAQHHYRLQASS